MIGNPMQPWERGHPRTDGVPATPSQVWIAAQAMCPTETRCQVDESTACVSFPATRTSTAPSITRPAATGMVRDRPV